MTIPLLGGDLAGTIKTLGYIGVSFIVFAESGLFFGFFLPGDSLLFTAGLLASQGFFNIYFLSLLLSISAVAGDSTGYLFGKKIGPALFNKKDSFFFHKEHVARTHAFYEKHGPKAIVLGRFIPIVRTFVPILAGVGEMKYSLFLKYNLLGGVVWSIGLVVAGYMLGKVIPDVDAYLMPAVIIIIFLSFLPVLVEILRSRGTSGWQKRKN